MGKRKDLQEALGLGDLTDHNEEDVDLDWSQLVLKKGTPGSKPNQPLIDAHDELRRALDHPFTESTWGDDLAMVERRLVTMQEQAKEISRLRGLLVGVHMTLTDEVTGLREGTEPQNNDHLHSALASALRASIVAELAAAGLVVE